MVYQEPTPLAKLAKLINKISNAEAASVDDVNVMFLYIRQILEADKSRANYLYLALICDLVIHSMGLDRTYQNKILVDLAQRTRLDSNVPVDISIDFGVVFEEIKRLFIGKNIINIVDKYPELMQEIFITLLDQIKNKRVTLSGKIYKPNGEYHKSGFTKYNVSNGFCYIIGMNIVETYSKSRLQLFYSTANIIPKKFVSSDEHGVVILRQFLCLGRCLRCGSCNVVWTGPQSAMCEGCGIDHSTKPISEEMIER